MTDKSMHKLSDSSSVPTMGFGTGTALYGLDAEESVLRALENGFVHIDSSQMYRNEESTGRAIAKYLSAHGLPRSSIYVTTKLGRLEPGETVHHALTLALERLQLDYVDLYLVHTPAKFGGPGQVTLAELWRQFEGVKRAGLAKSIGVSNYRLKDFDEFIEGAEIKPAVHQLEFNPYVLDTAEPIVEFHKKYNISTISYAALSPLYLFPGGPLDAILPKIKQRLAKDAGVDVTDEQVLTKWQEAKGTIQLTTSSKTGRLCTLLHTRVALPDLTEEEVSQIDDAGKKVHKRQYMNHMDL